MWLSIFFVGHFDMSVMFYDTCHNVAFNQDFELSFVYGALTCSSLAALRLVLCNRDYNLAPSALVAAVSKIKWGVSGKD